MNEQKLIDANDLILGIKKRMDTGLSRMIGNSLIRYIESAPVIDSVKHGEWIDTEHYSKRLCMTIHKTHCSVCKAEHEQLPFGESNYCSECGAKMDPV